MRTSTFAALMVAALTVLLGIVGINLAFADALFGDTFDDGRVTVASDRSIVGLGGRRTPAG